MKVRTLGSLMRLGSRRSPGSGGQGGGTQLCVPGCPSPCLPPGAPSASCHTQLCVRSHPHPAARPDALPLLPARRGPGRLCTVRIRTVRQGRGPPCVRSRPASYPPWSPADGLRVHRLFTGSLAHRTLGARAALSPGWAAGGLPSPSKGPMSPWWSGPAWGDSVTPEGSVPAVLPAGRVGQPLVCSLVLRPGAEACELLVGWCQALVKCVVCTRFLLACATAVHSSVVLLEKQKFFILMHSSLLGFFLCETSCCCHVQENAAGATAGFQLVRRPVPDQELNRRPCAPAPIPLSHTGQGPACLFVESVLNS